MEKFHKLLEKKMKEGKSMSPIEKQAKMNAVHAMRKMATDEMSEPLKHLKKVTVASDNPEGIKMGLDKAKEMMSDQSPEMEALEEEMGEDLDHDNEVGESPEHQKAVLGHEGPGSEAEEPESEEPDEDDMSPEELQAKIHELQMLLQEKSQHKM